jgi:hypothetical protein
LIFMNQSPQHCITGAGCLPLDATLIDQVLNGL